MADSMDKKYSNVPNLRFFNSFWNTSKIGDVLTIERGGSPRPIINFITKNSNGINWIKIGDVSNDGYIYKTEEKIIPEGAKHSRRVEAGDLLLSNSMSFGKPYILKIDGCIHDGWLVIKDKNFLFNKEFLRQYLGSEYCITQYKRLAAGGVVTNLNKELVGNALISYPNIDEQNKIASFLSLIDERISTQNKIIRELFALKCGLCQMIKEKQKTAPVFLVKDICKIGRGRVISKAEIEKAESHTYPVFSSQTSNNGVMGYIDSYDFDGEFLTWTTDGANAGTVFYHNEKFNCTNVCGTLKIINESINPYFLYLILENASQKYVSKNLANPKLMNDTMANIKVNIPDLKSQNNFVNVCKAIEKRIKVEQEIFRLLLDKKKFLLNNLFI